MGSDRGKMMELSRAGGAMSVHQAANHADEQIALILNRERDA